MTVFRRELQEIYDNSPVTEIVTDSTRGALTLKRGSAADTDAVLEVQNGAAVVKFSVSGNGLVGSIGNEFTSVAANPGVVAAQTLWANSSDSDKLYYGAAAVLTAGLIISSGLTMATNRILGRTTAATGAIEEITVGTGLTLSAGTLTNNFSGTVTSVAMSVPAFLSVSGSPITSSGTLAVTLSGTALPVLNGGTGSTAFTAGSVIFSNGTILTQDNANLFWDDSNNRLGIGNAAPSYALDVTGTLQSDKYLLGLDLSLIPVGGGQSFITTWWGMQLVGNKQSNVDYTPVNIGGTGSFSVIIPNQQAASIGLIVRGQTSQTANLIELRNVSNTGLSAFNLSGKLGLGLVAPTAYIHLVAGTTAATTAPMKFTAGTNMTAAEAGAVEWDGTNLFITQTTGPTRKTIAYTDVFTSVANGLTPASGGGTTNFLRADGTWAAPAGGIGGSITSNQVAFGSGINTIQGSSTFTYGNTTGLVISPTVVSSGIQTAFSIIGAANTGLTATTESPDLDLNLARTVEWLTGGITNQRAVRITAPTYAFVGASNITNAVTVSISGAPTAGANATITNSLALWIETGLTRFGGDAEFESAVILSNLTNNRITINNNAYQLDTPDAIITDQTLAINPIAVVSGTQTAFTITGAANTGQTTLTEIHDLFINLNRTVTWAADAPGTQRAILITAPTYAAGVFTVMNAVTFTISGPPIEGTNVSIPEGVALEVESGISRFGGPIKGAAGTVLNASLRLPHGMAPASPEDGAIWTRTTGLYVRINGITEKMGTGTGTIGGSIAANQIATGNGTDVIQGSNTFQYSTDAGLSVTANSQSFGTFSLVSFDSAAHTNQTASTEALDIVFNLSATKQFAAGALATQRAFVIQSPTYAFVGASTITTAATVAITGAPTPGANATILDRYALWVQSGKTQLADLGITGSATIGTGLTLSQGILFLAGTQTVGAYGKFTLVPVAGDGGGVSPAVLAYLVGAANTNLGASTESCDIDFDLARTVQWAVGALSTQRAVVIRAPTYAFVGASTITTASTLSVTNAPTAGTNATITNRYAINVESGAYGGPAGTAALPTYSVSQANTGMYSTGADAIGFATAGVNRLIIDTVGFTATLPWRGQAGTATAPAFSFGGDPNSGIYNIGADQVGISTNGTLRVTTSTTAVTSTLPILLQNGTVAAPALAFSGDSNTGIYNISADRIGFSTGGVLRFDLSSTAAIYAVKITTVTSIAGGASLNIPHGVAPTSPVNGDEWTTTAGKFIRVNGVTTNVSRLVAALTDGATINIDAATGDVFTVTIAGNRTIAAPTNPVNGRLMMLRIRQDATGSRTLTWDAAFAFTTALPAPTLSTGANKIDYVGFVYDSTTVKWHCISYVLGHN